MTTSEIIGKAIKNFAEPQIRGVTQEQAKQLIDLIGTHDGYGWKQYQAKILLAQMESRVPGGKIDLETLEKVARYKYPDNALAYVPALCIFALFFAVLAVVLL